MKLSFSLFGPLAVALALAPACSSSGGGGGDDDDDLDIDTGDGDADSDADADTGGDESCDAVCANVVTICADAEEAGCIEQCERFQRNSTGECLAAVGDLNGCVSHATDCDPEQGVGGCETEGQAVNTTCANGCYAIVECVNACPAGDQACGEGCFTNGDPDGVEALEGVLSCWQAECGDPPAEGADQTAWEQCLEDSCYDERDNCR